MTTTATKPTTVAYRPRVGIGVVVRRAGWTVLGVGILLAGFVVYEIFVTSFFANRAQAGLTADLNTRIVESEVEVITYERSSLDLIAVPAGLADDVAFPAPAAVEAALQASEGFTVVEAAIAEPADPEAVGPVGPIAEAPEGSIVAAPSSEPGNALGRIEIASIGLDWTVVEGVSRSDLRNGAGHMPDTALPGMPGNAVISGHRTTYGAPFSNLGRTHKGDLITITTVTGSHVYQIVEKKIVLPNETWVTGQWEGSWLTLTTCHPKFSSQQRLVVFARLVGGPNAATLGGGA